MCIYIQSASIKRHTFHNYISLLDKGSWTCVNSVHITGIKAKIHFSCNFPFPPTRFNDCGTSHKHPRYHSRN